MIIIGIDPGAKGGIAIYDEIEHKMILHKCPETTREMSAILESAKVNADNQSKIGKFAQEMATYGPKIQILCGNARSCGSTVQIKCFHNTDLVFSQ